MSTVPWRVGDAVSWCSTSLIGLLLLLVSWWGISGSASLSTQVRWASVGVGGILVAGVGNTVWLLSGRRAVGERRRRLLPDVDSVGDAPADVAASEPLTLVATTPMTRYHRAGCLLVATKPARAATRDRHEQAGRQPCGVCEP